jgi:hypothetical protein
MSEFSDSYHLVGSVDDGVELIRRAGRRGFVLPESEPFTCVIVDQPDGGADPSLIAANRGLLIHYQYGEDHGVWIELYDQTTAVTLLRLEWGPDFTGDRRSLAEFDAAPWLARGLLDDLRGARLRKIAASVTEGPHSNVGPEVARLLGLERFEHLACAATSASRGPWDHVQKRIRQRFPDAVGVALPMQSSD